MRNIIYTIFDPSNKVWSAISKVGSLGFLSICAIILSIPIVTAVPAWIALYYAIVKNVRRDRSYAWREYFHAFGANFKQGAVVSLLAVAYVLITVLWYSMSQQVDQPLGRVCFIVAVALAIMFFMILVWLIPVLSRFESSLKEALKFSFYLSVRNLFMTIFFIVMLAICVQLVLILHVLWVILPGLYVLLNSCFIERVFLKYEGDLPDSDDDEADTWYLER